MIMIIRKLIPLELIVELRKGANVEKLNCECYIPRLKKFLQEIMKRKAEGWRVERIYVKLIYKIDVF